MPERVSGHTLTRSNFTTTGYSLDSGFILSGSMAVHLPWPKRSFHPTKAQAVLRSVPDGIFIHFYLACGHLITVPKGDSGEQSPHTIECWACAEEAKAKQ